MREQHASAACPVPSQPNPPSRPLALDAVEVARQTGLRAAKVRYYAEEYGRFLGLERGAGGLWAVAEIHLIFFKALADGKSVTQAIRAAESGGRGALAPASAGPAGPRPTVRTPAPLRVRRPQQAAAGPGARPEPLPPRVSRRYPADAEKSTAPAALTARLEDLALHIEDLSEETKQVQVLLSRVIALLDDARGPGSPAVQPWDPPDLTRSGAAESTAIVPCIGDHG